MSWWSDGEQSCDEIWLKIKNVPTLLDYWHKRFGDRSQVPDWFVQFVHQFGEGRLWTGRHHNVGDKQVL